MTKWRTEAGAKESASNRNLYYGCQVWNGMWYVGTKKELTKLEVHSIRRG